jgi:hypothetical protein
MLTLSGTVGRLYLGDLLEWLHLTHATGRLLLSSEDVTRAFDLYCGKLAFASSSRASERLGSWLLRNEVVPRNLLLRALAVSQTQGELFTSVLKRDVHIAHSKLVEASRSLATALASRVLREDQVAFTFDPSWPVADLREIDLELDCRNLVMQAAYRVDTDPASERSSDVPRTTLTPATLENLFWHILTHLEGEMVEATAVEDAHRSFHAVGQLLNRWVVQGPPLLPVGPRDATRVLARLKEGKPIRLEDSPTLTWNLLALVNGLDAPLAPRASSANEAWIMAGDEAPEWVHLILDTPRWRRESESENDTLLLRAALSRGAAARSLAEVVGLEEDAAATAAVLPVVLLEFVATALATSPLASSAMQRTALHHLLPLVGRAVGAAAGMPEVLLAALTSWPHDHPAVRLTGLVGLAVGDLIGAAEQPEEQPGLEDPAVAAALAAARRAAEHVARAGVEQR